MIYRDIVELIKINQIQKGISVKTLAGRLGITPQVLTDIRGYRLKVSEKMFDNILRELGIVNISQEEKISLLKNQKRAQENKHRKYIRERQNKERGKV